LSRRFFAARCQTDFSELSGFSKTASLFNLQSSIFNLQTHFLLKPFDRKLKK